jgi:hypothetical protein
MILLVAALLCTRTDEELERILVPELADMITGAEESIKVRPPQLGLYLPPMTC